ncbi:myo-inosose-2 dehydratase [Rhizobium sp. DKSPLA3]|uniref:Myo-inosose-2 dehydratase n=1 Tax=Rhizobium quercicola TaxID=2901226 RepID=A0A9X1T961_9HYPH|nr:myo-inosose-2 dehydratase [Rhizobium quercicola]MCD7111478.1 myo-inosose-2 dehydratase [Rhizobium quercicola]
MRSETLSALPPAVRLAVSPLSWANDVLEDLGADIPVETCLDEAGRAGYDGVELGRKLPRTKDLLAPLLDSRKLSLASGWHSGQLAEGSVEDEMAAVAAHADLLRAMGSTVMVYGETAMMTPGAPLDAPMSQRRQLPGVDVAAYAARLTDFGTRLADTHGLTLAYHHHLMMVAETFDEISMIFDAAGPSVGLLLDTGHAAAAGFAYTQLIERFGDRIVHIHLKDVRAPILDRVRAHDLSFNDGVRSGMFTVPGDGSLDFAPLARFVRESGYRGWLVVEAEQDPAIVPPLPAVTAAFHHILAQFSA